MVHIKAFAVIDGKRIDVDASGDAEHLRDAMRTFINTIVSSMTQGSQVETTWIIPNGAIKNSSQDQA